MTEEEDLETRNGVTVFSTVNAQLTLLYIYLYLMLGKPIIIFFSNINIFKFNFLPLRHLFFFLVVVFAKFIDSHSVPQTVRTIIFLSLDVQLFFYR